MKIAFFTDTFYPFIGGISTAVMSYSVGLAAAGHQVMIVAPRYPELKKHKKLVLPENVTIELLPSTDWKIFPDLRLGFPVPSLFKNITEFQPDIIHTHSPGTIGLLGIYLSKMLKIPVVTTHHIHLTDRETLKMFHLYHSKVAHKAQSSLKVLLRSYLNQHKLVFVPSMDVWHDLATPRLKKKMIVLPNPIAVKEFAAGRKNGEALRKKLQIEHSLIYVGRLSAEKNIDLVIRVFAKLQPQFPDLKLVLVGDGPERENLFKLASELDVNKSIVWTGAVMPDELVKDGYYFLGDVFITLSRFETQGLTTVEAMACGRPVIGANAHATIELIHENGILISSKNETVIAEEVAAFLRNHSLLQKCAKNSTIDAQKFSIEDATQKLLAAYRTVM